ncbi:hypothetical protein RGCCGE502_08350 [Rhizobium grahamii CCGE 502]|uniref:Secreted protein n=2 Tax=Rhizobium grahamii TaxID=1120045 RepID=S3IHP3_9HYPH|nr:hypothetical protein RGCCGE502_08350 [Rhizobium grahamii CCGE 502]
MLLPMGFAHVTQTKNDDKKEVPMRSPMIAAAIFAAGLATSAFAQSNPDPIGPTNGGSTNPSSSTQSGDYTSSDNGTHPIVVAPVDPTTTQSITPQPKAMDCPGMPQANSGVDTRGGESGASISDACREYDN